METETADECRSARNYPQVLSVGRGERGIGNVSILGRDPFLRLFIAAIILDRNLQIAFHKRMATAGLENATDAQDSGRSIQQDIHYETPRVDC